jgi:Tfp pilus assembly protein PilX
MTRGKQNQKHPQRGAAMLLAVIMMAVFAIMGSAYWRHLHVSIAHARDGAKQQLSRELAEAGIARAIAELRAGHTTFTGVERVPIGEGIYTVELTPLEGTTREITATGALADGNELRRPVRIKARIHLDAAGLPASVEYLAEGS